MDELSALLDGLSCKDGLLQLAIEHPELLESLIAIAKAIRADVGSKYSAGASPSPSPPASSSASASQAPAASLPTGFVRLQEISCITPRGKHDVEITETGITLFGKSAGAGGAPPGAPVVVAASNVTGVFSLSIQDKYKKGDAGIAQLVVITLANAVMIGKTPHKAVAFSDNQAALAKAGAKTLPLTRAVDADALKDAKALPLSSSVSSSSAGSVTGEDAFGLLRGLLSAVFGRLGGEDKAIFSSSSGQASVKCYHKVNDGVLFPLRRAFIFGPRPLVCLPHSEVEGVSVGRSGGSVTKTFDLDVRMSDGKTVQFSMLDNEELEGLRRYVSTRTFGAPAPAAAAAAGGTASAAPAPKAAATSTATTAETGEAASAAAAADSAPTVEEQGALGGASPSGAPTAPAAAAIVNMNEVESDNEGGDDDDEEEDSEFDSDEDDEDDDEDDSDDDGGDDDDDDDGETEDEDEGEGDDDDTGPASRKRKAAPKAVASAPSTKKRKVVAQSEDDEEDGDEEENGGGGESDGDDDADGGSEEDAAMSGDELKALLADAQADSGGAAGGRGSRRRATATAAGPSSSSAPQ